ncbi:DMT family transporter [Zavarzinia compransoris]|uniref:EamA/RhaT family transporter n=1 Tax=Zavarzinia compransoris TaxID=1264899 RepID=A0A317E0R8_9PROT|nr:DMT family transporter [Zavarzinia compransoris]PWR19710.1 EamA/RhaT family transporter [Zavarzinia compransoris]TDP43343.1 drug/metabolite transporter (DMT)-like permease [Zavarzinia compransoris]
MARGDAANGGRGTGIERGEILLVVLFCLLWSSAFAPAKLAVAHAPPLLLLACRFVAAGLLCLGLARWRGEGGWPARRDLAALALLGLFNNAIYLGLSWSGMASVSSGFAAVLISTNPLLTALVAGPVLGERMTGRKLAGLLLGLAGVALVLRSRLGTGAEDAGGALLVLGGLLSLVAGTILYKRLAPRHVGPWTGNGLQALAAGLVLVPASLLIEDWSTAEATTTVLLAQAWMVLGVSVGGYMLWFRLLARHSATAASSLHFLMPPLGLGFGWLLAGESVPALDLLGIVPIACGIALVTRPARPGSA